MWSWVERARTTRKLNPTTPSGQLRREYEALRAEGLRLRKEATDLRLQAKGVKVLPPRPWPKWRKWMGLGLPLEHDPYETVDHATGGPRVSPEVARDAVLGPPIDQWWMEEAVKTISKGKERFVLGVDRATGPDYTVKWTINEEGNLVKPKNRKQQKRGYMPTSQEVRAPEPKRCVACGTGGPHKIDECIRQVRQQHKDGVDSVLKGCSRTEEWSREALDQASKVGRLAFWAGLCGAFGFATGLTALALAWIR